ncbi:hypothetical protein WJ49_32010 [Burkholderia ubonensis]|nr:hypothetical protein WJ49_32010 [Burkholderia ubonensis]KVL68028.1 hypothetical protein WJ48_13295 [Burkholderia ubonensis]
MFRDRFEDRAAWYGPFGNCHIPARLLPGIDILSGIDNHLKAFSYLRCRITMRFKLARQSSSQCLAVSEAPIVFC